MEKCSICGKFYEGYGNNAQPINDGRCCNQCNLTIVVPRRMQDYTNSRIKTKIKEPSSIPTTI